MSLNKTHLPALEEMQEAGKKFLELNHKGDYVGANEYYSRLTPRGKEYIQTEPNCNWELLNMYGELYKLKRKARNMKV